MHPERLILSIVGILFATHLLGWVFQQFRQPRVIGEITAGIVLGPSLLGHFFPRLFDYIFPSSSITALRFPSQLGVLLFMFVVGLEVDPKQALRQPLAILLISHFSILTPLIAGAGLAVVLYSELAGQHVNFLPFALFMGTAMSITAFPVLARILRERNLIRTKLGTMAISCAAVNDIIAWLLLAVLTAMVRSSLQWSSFGLTLLWLLLFLLVMFFPVRRAASLLEKLYEKRQAGLELFSIVVLIMLAASWSTERLGVHALFGAFIAGLIMPKGKLMTSTISSRIETLALMVLLPLFFASAGLRTRIDLLAGRDLWCYMPLIIGIAVAGKLAGVSITSRISGMSWKDSIALGILMNTRGLVELVVLNAGLELGILTPRLFTMMVIMALVTTFMTTPILHVMKIAPKAA